jgi:hypothetical protein
MKECQCFSLKNISIPNSGMTMKQTPHQNFSVKERVKAIDLLLSLSSRIILR